MKKRIAFVSKTMVVGGVEKVLIELLNEIDYDLYDVDLWLSQPGGEFFYLIPPLVNIKYWGIDCTRKMLFKQIADGRYLNFIKGIYYRCLLRLHSKNWVLNEIYATRAQAEYNEKYDCVVAFQGISPTVVATSLYRIEAPIKIVWIHGKDAFSSNQITQMAKLYKKFSHIFCVSESTKTYFCDQFSSFDQAASVFYNLNNAEEILEKGDEVVSDEMTPFSIVTVGRLSKLKGQIMVPRTVRFLLDAGYKVHWYLVGDGELRPMVEKEIQKYDVAENVILLGTKTNPYPYIKKCDIYVQPSFSEGYCTTTVEAKILNKPIVTTDAPGMREQFISGENGLIVDEMTPESLFEGIKLLIDHPEMREKFKRNLAKETYDNSKELQKLYDFIES